MISFKKQLKTLVYLFILIAFCCCSNNNVDATDTNEGGRDPKEIANELFSQARDQYDALPDGGKFASAALVGFGISKLAVNSAMKIVKIAAVAFVA